MGISPSPMARAGALVHPDIAAELHIVFGQPLKGNMMRNKLLNSLLAASLATLTVSAFAENATPREPTPGQANPTTGITQNGSPVGTTSSTTTTTPGMNMNNNMQANNPRMTSEQTRAYMDARQACSTQTGTQMQACNDAANKKWSSVDAKCQKVSGPALADCLKGADHGG